MNYSVNVKKSAEKELAGLESKIRSQIAARLRELVENPFPQTGFKKLKGGLGYRLTSGDYRILYKVDTDQKVVEIVAIGNRKDVYR